MEPFITAHEPKSTCCLCIRQADHVTKTTHLLDLTEGASHSLIYQSRVTFRFVHNSSLELHKLHTHFFHILKMKIGDIVKLGSALLLWRR